jgi:hypothetical protein
MASRAALDAFFDPGSSLSPSISWRGADLDDEIRQWIADVDSSSSSSPLVDDFLHNTAHRLHDLSDSADIVLDLDALFRASSSAANASQPLPETPLLHDASAFSSLSLASDKSEAIMLFEEANAELFNQILNTPPSASDAPALSFSPTSPFTPGTGLLNFAGLDGEAQMPLFGFEEGGMGMYYDTQYPAVPEDKAELVSPTTLGLGLQMVVGAAGGQGALDAEGLIPISGTPSVVPVPLSSAPPQTGTATPLSSAKAAAPSPLPVGRGGPTGHRKNLTPASLLPVEAPTQTRMYKGPSATSRKEVPAFAIVGGTPKAATSVLLPAGTSASAATKKRKLSEKKKYADEEDEESEGESDEDEYAGPSSSSNHSKKRKTASATTTTTTTTDADGTVTLMPVSEIEAKRRQNTLAARRSRHRKLAYVRDLEETVQRLMRENEELRARVERSGV